MLDLKKELNKFKPAVEVKELRTILKEERKDVLEFALKLASENSNKKYKRTGNNEVL